MISTTTKFIEKFLVENKIKGGSALEVGSLDVNGNIKDQLTSNGFDYLGIDMREGNNVDRVIDGHDIKKHFEKGQFDLVICIDTMEHDKAFWVTVSNMKWVLKKGGWIILGAPSLRHPRHNHPSDYWRFFGEAFEALLSDMDNVHVEELSFADPQDFSKPDQIYAWGQKK